MLDVVELTRILGNHVERAAESAEGPAVRGVRMRGTVDVRAGRVDRMVDHVRCEVELPVWPAVDDFPGAVDE